ncbi:conserved hypothetical protein [Ricinus communis]|uniref:Uncharacterized protein n=1 Tax=Ricinus communis TaxID=3988 RepID=B9T3P4_RICCO|nr:conserved hypothetical protein [Ricinus communis]
MCPGTTDTESRGIINGEHLVSKDGAYNEDTMRARGEAKFLHGLLRRIPVTSNLGQQLPLNEQKKRCSLFLYKDAPKNAKTAYPGVWWGPKTRAIISTTK